MFDWLFGKPFHGNSGIEKIRNDFIQMLQTAQKEFELACQVTLHGEDPALVKEKLLNYDKSVNKAERSIRKELVVHCAVRGTIETECLAMMSISKDAERLGDYSNFFISFWELFLLFSRILILPCKSLFSLSYSFDLLSIFS